MIHPKLKGLPRIYYINLDQCVDRRNWMENQFKNFGIVNYNRVNASEFLVKDYDKWKDNTIHNADKFPRSRVRSIVVSINFMRAIKEWFETTNEEYMILVEDDTDFSLVDYWDFDWEYLMDNIPYDWDAIQLMCISGERVPCYLHPKDLDSFTEPMLINRNYAEKLLSLYFVDGKFNFIKKVNRMDVQLRKNLTIADTDDSFGFNGRVYQLPLIAQHPFLDISPKWWHVSSILIHRLWWTKYRHKFTLDDFFTYGKSYDDEMTFSVSDYQKLSEHHIAKRKKDK